MISRHVSLAVAWLLSGCACVHAALASEEPLEYVVQNFEVRGHRLAVTVPQGYRLELLTEELSAPRMLTFDAQGNLFIGSRGGAVYRVAPPYAQADILVELAGYPHSVAFRDGEILIATTDGLYRAPFAVGQTTLDEDALTLLAPLPGGRGHDSRTVRTGPDGRVYASLGIAGNCSDQYLSDDYPPADRRGGVLVLNPGGTGWEPFGTGLRNPVGFDWHPRTGVMYSSNNGPDHWGFDLPPEYFSRITPGSFHGMPWFQFDGDSMQRDECISREPPRPRAEVEQPVATFPARNAPMAVAFVPDGAMDDTLVGDAVVALHGSWATRPAGGPDGAPASRRHPKLVTVRFKDGEAVRVDDLVTGFQLENGDRWARPVGVAIGADGALYFTSDAGLSALFRLSRVSVSASASSLLETRHTGGACAAC